MSALKGTIRINLVTLHEQGPIHDLKPFSVYRVQRSVWVNLSKAVLITVKPVVRWYSMNSAQLKRYLTLLNILR